MNFSHSKEAVVPIGTVGYDVVGTGVGAVGDAVGIEVGCVAADVGIEVGSDAADVGTDEGDIHDNGLLLQLEKLHVYTSLYKSDI